MAIHSRKHQRHNVHPLSELLHTMRAAAGLFLSNPSIEVSPDIIMQRSGLHDGSASALQRMQARLRADE